MKFVEVSKDKWVNLEHIGLLQPKGVFDPMGIWINGFFYVLKEEEYMILKTHLGENK